jgi:precorrin-2 dehydrogenase
MLPISLDLAQIRVMLVGDGALARRRLALLDEAGAVALEIYAPDPEPVLAEMAGARLHRRLPLPAEIARARLVFVAGIAEPAASEVSRVAKAAGVLVNIEDDRHRSDFHSTAVIRRGDLTVAISTNGRSPGLASLMRRVLEYRIGPEWEWRIDEIAALRQAWRAAGADPAVVGHRTEEWVARQGWLDRIPPDPSHEPSRPIR